MRKVETNWHKEAWDYTWKKKRIKKSPHFSEEEIKKLNEKWVDETIKNLNLKKKSKLLFLCCGAGTELIGFARRGFEVVGLDFSKEALKILKRKLNEENLSASLLCKDMRNIPFKNEFDVIFCVDASFGHLKNKEEDFKVIKSIANTLKVDGIFVYENWNKDNVKIEPGIWGEYDSKTDTFFHRIKYKDKNDKTIIKKSYIRIYSLEEMKFFFEKVNLIIKEVYGNIALKIPLKDSHWLTIYAGKI